MRAPSLNDVEFSPEDATRSDRDFLVEMVRIAVEAGATTINMPDTVGYSTHEEYGRMFAEVRERIPAIDAQGIILSSHCHDDLGLAVATHSPPSRAARVKVECLSIRQSANVPANAALEEIAAASMCAATTTAFPPPSSLKSSYATSQVPLARIITFHPPPNKASWRQRLCPRVRHPPARPC